MSFELENPEIADIVQTYKSGEIAYQEAKDLIVSLLAYDINIGYLSEHKVDELKQRAKKLLLGE